MSTGNPYPPIGDYALIGDCHGAALVSRSASIDWCCAPRFDSPSCFGRLLDWETGGFCSLTVGGLAEVRGASVYVDDSMVLATDLEARDSAVRVLDFFALGDDGAVDRPRELIRIVECRRGLANVRCEVAPRFDYGAIRPWLRRLDGERCTLSGVSEGLLVWTDGVPNVEDDALACTASLSPGERVRLA